MAGDALGEAGDGGLGDAAAGEHRAADVEEAVEEGAGGDNDAAGMDLSAPDGADAKDPGDRDRGRCGNAATHRTGRGGGGGLRGGGGVATGRGGLL